MDKLTDDEINALIDGDADDELRTKAQNPALAAQVEAARQMEASLRQRLYRDDCPSAHTLGDYVLNRLPAYEMEAVTRHLSLCVRCRDEIETLTNFLDAPDDLVDESPARTGIRRSGTRYQAARQIELGVMRGEDDVYSQMLAEDSFTVFLEARLAAGGVLLTGQVVDADASDQEQWHGALIELRQADTPPVTATMNEVGEFVFRHLERDAAEIVITTESGNSIWLLTEALIPDGVT